MAIDAAPFRGILSVAASSLRAGAPILRNPANRGRAVALTFEEFRDSWANNLSEAEAHTLYDTYHVPASGAPLFQDVLANLNPFTDAKVDVANPDRGPLLIISGEKGTTIPRPSPRPPSLTSERTRASPRSPRSPDADTR